MDLMKIAHLGGKCFKVSLHKTLSVVGFCIWFQLLQEEASLMVAKQVNDV